MQTSLCISSMIKAFVILYLKSIVVELDTCKISIFLLVSEAEQTGLSVTRTEAPKTCFLAMRTIYGLQYLLYNQYSR